MNQVSATNHAYNTLDIFNQTVTNSGVAGTAYVQMAGVVPTTFTQTDHDIYKDVLALSNIASVQNLCNQNKADLVLVLLFNWEGHDCGQIRLPVVWNSFSVLKRLRRSGLA